MLPKISEFVKTHIDTMILCSIIMLFVLFSFAVGYIIAKYQDREPIIIHQSSKIKIQNEGIALWHDDFIFI